MSAPVRDILTVQDMGTLAAPYINDPTMTPLVAANDLEFPNDGRTLLLIQNGGTSGAQTATIISVADPYGRTQDVSVVVAQGDTALAGPFAKSDFNQTGGEVHVDSANEDDFNFAALRMIGG